MLIPKNYIPYLLYLLWEYPYAYQSWIMFDITNYIAIPSLQNGSTRERKELPQSPFCIKVATALAAIWPILVIFKGAHAIAPYSSSTLFSVNATATNSPICSYRSGVGQFAVDDRAHLCD
eukprot:Tbor_TRINITY_DN6131_c1_g1::TRINITY_DN6131_c1_g1_i1::g.21545::m.21545